MTATTRSSGHSPAQRRLKRIASPCSSSWKLFATASSTYLSSFLIFSGPTCRCETETMRTQMSSISTGTPWVSLRRLPQRWPTTISGGTARNCWSRSRRTRTQILISLARFLFFFWRSSTSSDALPRTGELQGSACFPQPRPGTTHTGHPGPVCHLRLLHSSLDAHD